tara:strand:- start:801 stop:1124 length:324 start_codon:yes stop_codon:yes gene_type:complete
MLYEKMRNAWNEADVETYKALHHEDWSFTFHSTGRVVTSADVNDQDMKNMMMAHKNTDERCIYENDDILVQHAVTEFSSGDKEAVMMVSLKKDGLIWRTETGVTPLK